MSRFSWPLSDGVVVNEPDFEVGWNVDLVRSVFMIAAGAGVGGAILIGQQGVTVDGLIWHFGLSDLTLPYRDKL